jgi:hypothetical protein
MSLTNLNNVHLDAAKVAAAQTAIAQLETALADINVTLTAHDRQKYGSINEQNKLFVNKVSDYHKNRPELSAPQPDWVEFERDYHSRAALEGLIDKLDSLALRLKNAKTLHDHDNYQAALIDYAYTHFMAGTGANGFETKMNELKQFFTKTARPTPTTPAGEDQNG